MNLPEDSNHYLVLFVTLIWQTWFRWLSG